MNVDDSIILYGDSFLTSPYVFSAYVSLVEKGLPFAYDRVALHEQEQRRADYVRLSLTGRVPALEHRGASFSESAAIVEYLDETFPAPRWPALLPASPVDRARARQIMGWLRSDLAPLREARSSETIFYDTRVEALGSEAAAAADKLFRIVDRILPDGALHVLGQWSIVDAELAFVLQRLVANGDPVPPKALTYARAQWERASVAAFACQRRDPYVA